MKAKTSELTGVALDWAVAKVCGIEIIRCGAGPSQYLSYRPKRTAYKVWRPSTNWAQGGPIIERERISIRQWTNVPVVHAYMPVDGAEWSSDGVSPLVAAMRCYVASKLGDEVDVPEGLSCPK